MNKIYREFVKDCGFLDLLDLFDYKLTAITRATAHLELRRIILSRAIEGHLYYWNSKYMKEYLPTIDVTEKKFMFIDFRNYLEFEVKENN